jgi:tRNA threonylcarbamoyladenosine biosynthesis protein TsaE
MSDPLKLAVADEQATAAFGAALAQALKATLHDGPAIVALVGTLGAGKTRLVQAVAKAVGVADGAVTSPTFVLVHEYDGQIPIFHFDAYRLKSSNEFAALGPEEYFSRAGWSLIEWADQVTDFLPPQRLEIAIESTGPGSREITVIATGPEYQQALAELTRLCWREDNSTR